MEHPDVWYQLGKFVHQDFLLVFPDIRSGVTEFLATISPQQRGALEAHLSLLTSGKFSNADLARAWSDSGAEISVGQNQMRQWLEELRRSIG